MKGMKKSMSMPSITEIPKTHRKAFNIKKASVLDIMSTVESPSHWRYFMRKNKKKEGYLTTMKFGPFVGGIPHTGFGNTVGISWKKKNLQKVLATKVRIFELISLGRLGR